MRPVVQLERLTDAELRALMGECMTGQAYELLLREQQRRIADRLFADEDLDRMSTEGPYGLGVS